MYTKTWNHLQTSKGVQTISSKADNNGPWTSVTAYPSNYSVTLPQTKTGQSVPNWRQLIAEGKLAASPYSCSFSRVEKLEPGSAAIEYRNPGVSRTKEEFSGFFRQPALPSIPNIPDAVGNKALERILGKIRWQVQHANVGPALGELRSTVRSFGTPASAILSLTNRHINRLELAARHLGGAVNFRRIQWHRIVASSYLEYAFFLRPLLKDTEDIAESLARWKAEKEGDLPRPTSDFLQASYSTSSATQYVGPVSYMSPCANLSYKEMYTNNVDYGVRYQVKLKHSLQAEFGSNDRLLQLVGLKNPLNFIPTIWEVLPWSWLVDYFLNVQKIIEAGVTDTSNVEWIVKSQRTKVTQDCTVIPGKRDLAGGWAPTSWVDQGKHLGSWRIVRTALNRSLPASLGLPIPVVSYPNNIDKLANMVAALFARRSHANSLWVM